MGDREGGTTNSQVGRTIELEIFYAEQLIRVKCLNNTDITPMEVPSGRT